MDSPTYVWDNRRLDTPVTSGEFHGYKNAATHMLRIVRDDYESHMAELYEYITQLENELAKLKE